jgi:hypothetical protein
VRHRAEQQLVLADDKTVTCSDVGSVRICWGQPERVEPGCGNWACLGHRTEPEAPAAMGWRCTGAGADRICRPRSYGASPFVERDGARVQAHPRLPDDGEWTCTDSGGAVVCSGGQAPAGVAPSAADPGWFCGNRRGTRERPERVCVDFSPDLPQAPGPWRCRFEGEHRIRRVCVRDPSAHLLGDACSPSAPCLDGARCLRERCVPVQPTPSCIIDADCEPGRCRFGSCLVEAP